MSAEQPPRRHRPPVERGGYVPRTAGDKLPPPEQVPSARLDPPPDGEQPEQPEEPDDQRAGA